MPLFRRGALEDAVAGESQSAAGERIKQGSIGHIERIAGDADVLMEGLRAIWLRNHGTDADNSVAELIHRGQANIGMTTLSARGMFGLSFYYSLDSEFSLL